VGGCRAVRSKVGWLATTRRAAWPSDLATHIDRCTACGRRLEAERLARSLVATAARGVEPGVGFSDRVMALVDRASPDEVVDPWSPAWALLPVFGGVAVVTLVLFLQIVGGTSGSTEGEHLRPSSMTDQLVLGSVNTDVDLVLSAVFEK
jgi:hypothetical protein